MNLDQAQKVATQVVKEDLGLVEQIRITTPEDEDSYYVLVRQQNDVFELTEPEHIEKLKPEEEEDEQVHD